MMNIKILSDSTCDLSKALLEENNITLIPLTVVKEDQQFKDGVSITPAEIFAHVAAGGALCSTSANSVGEYEDMFRQYADQYDGVLHINISRRRGLLTLRKSAPVEEPMLQAEEDEIPDSESVDKFTLQAGFVALAYALAFGFMCLLGVLSDFTNSIAWGFNFLWASLAAMLIKLVVKNLRNRKLMHRVYISNYQMDRISGFSFDLMIVAGVAAIEINHIKNYILPVVILSAVGALTTYTYVRKASMECFKGFHHELFLMCFGTMTGTASNGVILMKQIDPGLRTPTSSLYILSNFPAMVMVAPLLFLLGFAAQSLNHAILACCIFFVLWLLYTIFLFRRKIFKKHFADRPVIEWTEED